MNVIVRLEVFRVISPHCFPRYFYWKSIIRRHLAIYRYQKVARARRSSSAAVSHDSTVVVDSIQKTGAALRVQKLWRKYWEKIIIEEELNLCTEAATIIQMYWRRFHHVNAYRTTMYKIRCIQKFIRSNIMMKRQDKVYNYINFLDS